MSTVALHGSDRWIRHGLVILAAAAVALFALDVGGPLRVAVLALFVLVAPGLAWARLMGTDDPGDTLALGLAISVGAAAVVSAAMALARWWSPGTALGVLAVMTLAGVARRRRG